MNILRASAYVRALSGAFLFGLSSGGIVIAADVSRASSDTVVVTASRLPESLDETLSSVTVIEREDIERLQARTLDELLAGVEGFALTRQGGVGQPTSVFLRGGESDHVLWLVDGVRIGSVTTGIPVVQDLPIDSIERIEIVRGPRSSLYGADAMGGVVQIFTRRGSSAPSSLRVSGGSNGTTQVALSAGLGDATGWLDLQASHLRTDGVNACLGRPFPPGGGCFTDEPDRDPYRNGSVNLRAGTRLGSHELEAFVQRSEARIAFDSSFLNESDLVNQVAGVKWVAMPRDGWRSTVQAGRSWDESTSFRAGGSFTSVFDSQRDSASWQNDLRVGSGDLTIGLDWLRDSVDSDTGYTSTSRDNRAVWGQYALRQGAFNAALALRSDDNEQFGSNTTGSIAFGWRSAGGIQTHASFGTAFKAPSFNELYYPGFSNPGLRPERGRTAELGLRGTVAGVRWNVAAYRSDIDDLVAFDVATFLPQNIARAELMGVESGLDWRSGPWRLSQTLSWLQAEDRSAGPNRGRELPRRPEWSGRTALDWSAARLGFGASVQWAGQRYDDLGNTRRLGGYAVVDLTASWQASPSVQLQARVANALDRRYETATLYPALGREAFLTVRWGAPR
jgi:vitamin B12 transporter